MIGIILKAGFTLCVIGFVVLIFAMPHRSPFPQVHNDADYACMIGILIGALGILALAIGTIGFIWS